MKDGEQTFPITLELKINGESLELQQSSSESPGSCTVGELVQ